MSSLGAAWTTTGGGGIVCAGIGIAGIAPDGGGGRGIPMPGDGGIVDGGGGNCEGGGGSGDGGGGS